MISKKASATLLALIVASLLVFAFGKTPINNAKTVAPTAAAGQTSADRQSALVISDIEGAVYYGVPNTTLTKPVAGALISATGAAMASDTTDAMGIYGLIGLPFGAYTVTPTKTGDVNSISSLDASLVARYSALLTTLTPNQIIAADVSNNGTVSSTDASLIARTASLIANPGIAGTWKFNPASRSYPNLISNQTAQNYDAILMGEVTGNWTPPVPPAPAEQSQEQESEETQRSVALNLPTDVHLPANRLSEQPEGVSAVAVSLPSGAAAMNGTTVVIPITVGNTTGAGIFSYDFRVLFDPNVLTPAMTAFDLTGTVSGTAGFTITPNPNFPGQLIISGFGTQPLVGAGTLLNLRFNVIGTAGTMTGMTNLTFSMFMFNEGVPAATTTNGTFFVMGTTAATVTVGGRVTTTNGKGIRNVRVTMTDSNGESRSVLTGITGKYRFDDVPAGGTYVFGVAARNYTFNQNAQVRTVSEDINDVNFTADDSNILR